MIKQKDLFSVFTDVDKYAPAAKTLGIRHAEDSTLYISYVADMLLICQPADVFFKTNQ